MADTAVASTSLPVPVRAFINYASDDREHAEWLYERLIRSGATSVWMDRADIRGGDKWKKEIDTALWRSQMVIALVTRKSADPGREWVHYEQERAQRLLKRVVPCLFEEEKSFYADGVLPDRLKPLDVIPFFDREAGLDRLLNEIRRGLRGWGPEFRNQAVGITHAFVGREDDLVALNRILDEESITPTGRRIIAIVGEGGMGKTMLAEELLRRLAYHYPGGVLIESRAGSTQPAAVVLRRWAEEMERPLTRQYEPEELQALAADIRARLAHYGEMLLLLDDVGEGDISHTRLLLEAMPADATRIITTRRDDVALALNAIAYRLEPMSDEDSLALLGSRLRDRFARHFPAGAGLDFDEELEKLRPALLKFVSTVQGHPLALHLGIGTCDYIGEIPDQVDRLIDSISKGVDRFELKLAREAADRNDSLARSLTVSLDDLERHDRVEGTDWISRYRALGVFPDGARISRKLLFATWGDDETSADDAADAIRGLIRRAMLRVDHQGYLFNHPVVRAYASGLLASEPEQNTAVQTRYARWVIDRAGAVLSRSPEEWHKYWLLVAHVQHVATRLIVTLGRELGDFRIAATAAPPDAAILEQLRHVPRESLELGTALARALREYVIRRPEWGEGGLQCLRLGLACARALELDHDAVEFLKRLGGALSGVQPRAARDYFAAALELARHTDDRKQIGEILSYSGELERMQGRSANALELLREALAIHEERGDATMQAKTLKYMGETLWRMSRLDDALEHYERAKTIYDTAGDAWGSADILNKIGSVHFNRGDHETAIEFFGRAVEAHEKVGNRSMQAEDYNDMGAAFRYLGRRELALDRFDKAIEMHVELDNRRLESITRSNRAGVLADLGRHEEALAEAGRAKEVAEDVGDPVPLIWSLCWEGSALEGLGRFDQAETRFADAYARCRDIDNPRGLAGVLGMFAALLARFEPRHGEAAAFLDEAIAILTRHRLKQAFGGRTLDQLRELRTGLAP